MSTTPTVLITGAARRIGATIAQACHQSGMNVAIHYRYSESQAQALAHELNAKRAGSAHIFSADLSKISELPTLIEQVIQHFGRLDVLINNASSFYATPVLEVTEQQWQDLFSSNVKGAFFLSQAAIPHLRIQKGQIINITDIHARKPMRNHSVYCMAKSALTMMTHSLAKELAPDIRVNAIAPGAVLPPEGTEALSDEQMQRIIDKTALKRLGSPQDIANVVLYLINRADYVTGQTIKVAGGR
jgi:pteridine reductase